MEELKHMLKVIHEENKAILTLLCIEDDDDMSRERIKEICETIDKKYDKLFYGKED